MKIEDLNLDFQSYFLQTYRYTCIFYIAAWIIVSKSTSIHGNQIAYLRYHLVFVLKKESSVVFKHKP